MERVTADGAYDSKENFGYLNNKGIESAIKVRKNASTRINKNKRFFFRS